MPERVGWCGDCGAGVVLVREGRMREGRCEGCGKVWVDRRFMAIAGIPRRESRAPMVVHVEGGGTVPREERQPWQAPC